MCKANTNCESKSYPTMILNSDLSVENTESVDESESTGELLSDLVMCESCSLIKDG